MRQKLLVLLFLSAIPLFCSAEVNWAFYGGGMYAKQYGAEGIFYDDEDDDNLVPKKGNSFEWLLGLNLQIPLSKKIYLETGVGMRNKLVLLQKNGFKFNSSVIKMYDRRHIQDFISENFDYGRGYFLGIPLKVGYNLKLNEKNQFLFSVGPYASVNISGSYENWDDLKFKDKLNVGLNASIVFRHRCMSFGLDYRNPLFKNGLNDYYKNSVNLTIGINFKSKGWATIGTVALATTSVVGGVAAAYSGSDNSLIDLNNISDNESSQYATPSNTIGSGGNGSTGYSQSFYQQEYDRWQRVAERHFESLTNLGYQIKSKDGKKSGGSGQGMSSSNYARMKKSFREAQNEMRKIRTKARKEGYTIQKASIEDATVKY